MKLQLPSPIHGKISKRVGRGFGSGKGGHTSGRGTKGQRSRVGTTIPLWFEGGQLPMNRKLPYLRGKLRFSTLNYKTTLVTLDRLNKLNDPEVTIESLVKQKVLAHATRPVKIVATGKLTKKLNIHGVKVSAAARVAIEQVGGTVTA